MISGPRGPTEEPLDLRAVEARLKERQAKMQANEHWEADDDCVALLAHCRALRAALQQLRIAHRTMDDALAVGAAAAVQAQARDCLHVVDTEAAAVLALARDEDAPREAEPEPE